MKISARDAKLWGVKLPPKKTKVPLPAQDPTERERLFSAACQAHGLPEPVAEYQFAPPRKWRADYAFPDLDVLVEVEGGIWVNGRHVRGLGFSKDLEKYAEATILGWFLLRCTPKMVEDGTLFRWLKRIQNGA